VEARRLETTSLPLGDCPSKEMPWRDLVGDGLRLSSRAKRYPGIEVYEGIFYTFSTNRIYPEFICLEIIGSLHEPHPTSNTL
jgi:hypothetical protein